MAKHTEGAVHLTSLDLDLTKFQENIQQIQTSTAEVADVAVQNLSKIREALNVPTEQMTLSVNTDNLAKNLNDAQTAMSGFEKSAQTTAINVAKIGTSFEQATKGQEDFFVRAKDANSLAKSYETLQVKIAGIISSLTASKVKDAGMKDLIVQAKEIQQSIIAAAAQIRDTGEITEDSYKAFESFKSIINEIAVAFSRLKTGSNEYKGSLDPITESTKKAISSLKTLEKTAVFKTSKDQVAALRAKYEEFLNTLKNSGISVEDAKAKLASLEVEFEHLESTVKRGNGTLENWVNKITESAKWQIANSALNLLRQSFGQLTDTIVETENSVIELQRVLNDRTLVDTEMAQTLYDIAYEYGQTFENVQEVALRFAQTGKTWDESLDATRATMLGLNTAELEVSTATEGLIAVMSQFNIRAEDLEFVIDKINITADRFPVTSEKIVAALQRAGGTANAFNMSLNETIATITALAEKTGRSGENIGTALNSLIIFTNKSENLKLFASLSDQMDKVVQKFQAGSASVIDVWTQLSQEIDRLSTQQQDALFNSSAYEEFASQFEAEAAEYAGTIQEIYGTAGAYRRNYLTVLLKDMGTVEDVLDNLTGAVGYSVKENETAMEAFIKKWNQLVVVAKELAIQFGNTGFLDTMKWIAETATNVLKLTKSLGGLNTILLVTIGLFIKIKREKISNFFGEWTSAVTTFTQSLSMGNGVMKSFSTAMEVSQLSFGSIAGGVGLAITAIASLKGWLDKMKQAQREAREEAIATGLDSVSSINSINDAYEEYNKAIDSKNLEELNEARATMLQQLGYEKEDLDILASKYEDLDAHIEQMTKDELALLEAKVLVAQQNAADAFEDASFTKFFDTGKFTTAIKEGRDELGITLEELNGMIEQLGVTGIKTTKDLFNLFNAPVDSYDEAKPVLDTFQEVITNMTKGDATQKWTSKQQKAFSSLIALITGATDVLNPLVTEYERLEGISNSLTDSTNNLGNAGEDAAEKWVTWVETIEEMDKVIDSLNGKMDSFQSSVKTVQNVVKQYNKTGIMTADMLQSLITLSPEYIDLIDFESGALSVNKEKLEELMAVNDNYMVQMAAMQIAKQYETLATELQSEKYNDLTEAEIRNMLTTQALGGEIYDLVMKLYSGQITSEQFERSLKEVGTRSGLSAAKVNVLTQSMVDYAKSVGMAIDMSGRFPNLNVNAKMTINGKTIEEWSDDLNKGLITAGQFQEKFAKFQRGEFDQTYTYSPASSTSNIPSNMDVWFPSDTSYKSSKSTERFKEEKDALNDLLEVYEHSIFLIEKNEKDSAKAGTDIAAIYKKMQDEVHKQAEYYRSQGLKDTSEEIRELQKKWWDYQDKIEEVLHGIYEESVASHERAIKMLEHQYESAEDRMDYSYMGQNLKKQLDYQVRIQREAERELERLAELGMDANSEAAQDVIDTWYEAERAIRDVSQKIQESILQPYEDFIDLADKFDIWEYMDFSKVDYLRMELQEINDMLADGTMSLKEYNAQLKQISYAIFDAQKELFEKQKDDIEKAKDEVVKAYKADVDSLKDQKTQVEDYYKSVIDGYNAEIDSWEKRKDKVNEYYDTLIDNLNEVQEANERINQQVDYYNERQKIVTNIEQAQARSGVEWREKEMEYQQQLIDLDEDWNRTQKEWDIQDQIDKLNALKEQALADIDLSIKAIRDTIEAANQAKQAAIDSIEVEIKGIEDIITATEEQAEEEIAVIDEQIKALSQTIAEAIKGGTLDGIVNSQAEIDKALVDGTNAMLGFIDSTNQTYIQTSQETANTVYGIYDTSFIAPFYNSIDEVAAHMQTSISSSASEAARAAMAEFQKTLVAPLKSEMASLVKQANTTTSTLTGASSGYTTKVTTTRPGTIRPAPKLPIESTPKYAAWELPQQAANIYITNNNANRESAAQRTQAQIMQALLSRGSSLRSK